jgi:hypothetical protein
MAKNLGWTLTKGNMSPCLPSTIGKAKEKNTTNESIHVSSKNPGERVFSDIASIRPANDISATKPHWCIKVAEYTQHKFSSFHTDKDDLIEPSCELFHQWKHDGHEVMLERLETFTEFC